MVLILLSIASILYFALQFEDKLKIPMPLGLIALAFIFDRFVLPSPIFMEDPAGFATLVLFLIPILLISDSLELEVDDLKENGWSLLYLAGIAVVLSVITAIFISDLVFAGYHLSLPAIIVLFTMLLATDPVSVVSIFSKFSLPERLKFLAEGESLFNDATALIIFVFIGLYALDGGNLTLPYIFDISLFVVLGSALLGICIGQIGLLVLKTTQNRIAEMMIVICTGYGAFEIAEHFFTLLNMFGAHTHLHMSGILTCITATITVRHVITKALNQETLYQKAHSQDLNRTLTAREVIEVNDVEQERNRRIRTKEDIQLLAILANTMIFVAMTGIIDLKLLWHYKAEILGMFLATTVIRALMMATFAMISQKTTRMASINFHWWGVLTFAGIKGGLSIVMLMMIPSSFEHLEMYKAVVIGVVLLSTFVYSAILIAIINRYQADFTLEIEKERADS